MKIGMKRLSTIMLILLMLFSAVRAFAIPGIPHQFYGYVTIDGVLASDGISVAAIIDGVVYVETTTVGGGYGWDPIDLFNVPADDPDTPEKDGGVSGDLVELYLDGTYAGSTAIFENGETTWLDIDVLTGVYELQLYEGWNLIGIPFIPDDTSIAVILDNILFYVESVWTYDGATGYWSSYSPYAPSDLTEILDGKGYWIKMTTDVLWEIDIG